MNETDERADRRCFVCGHRELTSSELQTCVHCLGRARRDLLDIVQLYAVLPAELTGRAGASTPLDAIRSGSDEASLPGGDILVLMAGGTNGNVTASRPTDHWPEGNREHAADQDGDAMSAVAVLATWEDDWRDVRGLQAAREEATVAGAAGFLVENLGWASQHHLAFDEFAKDVGRLRRTLQRTLREDDPFDRTEVVCPDCGGDLIRVYAKADCCPRRWVPPQPALGYDVALKYHPMTPVRGYWKPCEHVGEGHDQGGQRTSWMCRDKRCGRIVEPAEYWLAVRELHEQRRREGAS